MTIPIVIAAFGTTSYAKETYSFMNQRFLKRFPDHEIRWSFSSRMVKEHSIKHSIKSVPESLIKQPNANIQSPSEVLKELYAQGHPWVVVQSLHIINGHEFYRLVDEVKLLPVRTSMGLPLLTSYSDYCRTAKAMAINQQKNGQCSGEEALVLVGHGTDHPAWSAYLSLESIMRQLPAIKQIYGSRIFVGLIEGEPIQDQVVDEVVKSGVKKVRLVPFTLVAGVHFREDIAGEEDSWKRAFEDSGVKVEVDSIGIGYRDAVVDIFMDHIQDAMSAIPDQI